MKTLPIIITLFCISAIVIFLSSQAYAIPYIPPSAKYFNSEIVLIGKVVSSAPFSPTDTKYEIKVEQYLKNPQSQDTVTVVASGTNKSIGMTADTVFNVGQRVFLYLKQDQGNYVVWWYSHPTDFLCDPAPTVADLNSTDILGAGLDYEPLHVGASKSNSYLYAPNQPIIISYDAWNNQFTTKTFDVVFQVKNQTGQIIFNDTKQVELKPCIGHQIVNSTFTPKVAGTYEADVIFDNSLTGTTVEIPRPSGVEEVFLTLDKESYVPGDLMLIRGQVFLNATNVTMSLEKNHKSPVITKDFPISKNGTFYANFTIPFDASAKSWTLATNVGGGTLRQDLHFKSDSVPPLDQFWSGIASKDIQCKEELQLVIKSEDGSPACVKPDTAPKLIERGWAKEIVTNMSVESSVLNKTTGSELKIDLSNQTYDAGYPVYVNLKGVNQDSTCKIPSISVRDESDQSVVFGPTPDRSYAGSCVDPWPITFYAGLEKNTLITKSTRYSILATLDNKTYQKEFTVIPSSYSNKNITADSTQIMPGYLTFTSCLPYPDAPPNNGTLIRYTGFDMYRRYLAGPDTGGIPEIDDYLLKPGYTGSFVLQVHQGQFSKDANLAGGLYFLSENLLNLDNSTVLNNKPIASEEHPGLVLSYTPSFAKAGPEGYATITASIYAQQNATRGTYWLYLPPGVCGGNRVLLTIGEQPLAQPPDYIGYDFASHFAQGVGNPTKSDVTFELINAGIHTFENCSVNYVSENKTTTIKTFSVIPPGMEYKYHANLSSTSKVSGFLECNNPSITKVYPDVWVDVIPY